MPAITLLSLITVSLAISAIYLFLRYRRSRQALRDAQETLAEIQRAARVGYWRIDAPTGRITWSDQMFRLLNLDPGRESPTLERWISCFHPRDRSTCQESIVQAQTEGEPFEVDARVLNSDGFSIWTRITAHAAIDASGKVRTVSGTMMDISNRKAAEELIQDYTIAFEARLMELDQATEEIASLSIIDPVTRLNNSRVFAQRLYEEVNRVKRYHTSLSILLLNIDEFEAFRESHGHLAGDEALQQIANIVGFQARETDLAARLDDDLFGIILPHTSLGGALVAAERIRKAVQSAYWPVHTLTLSIGAAEYEEGQSYEDLITLASESVSASKAHGGNCVTHHAERAAG